MSSDEQAGSAEEPAGQEEPDAPTTQDGEPGADADEGVSGGESAEAGEPTEERRTGPPRWLVTGSAALAVAAVLVAAGFGIGWWAVSSGDDTALASAREDVVASAGGAVKAFTELDYENPDEYFERQRDVATGDLRKQLDQSEKTYRDAIKQAKTKVEATVKDVAVEELNLHERKASALVVVGTKVTQGGQSGDKVLRLEVQMTSPNEGEPWKLTQIGEVPVASTGSSGQ